MSHKPTAKHTPVAATIPAQSQRPAAAIPSFDALPDSAFIRESHLVQSPKRPDRAAPLPFSAPTLWRKVKNQTFPAPVKLSERITAWKVADVRAWIKAQTVVG
ncbi:MAG: AlpA family phage regulatory protein [Burkholderiaceae bacterium]|nr:MAG: AlpA family phage regulatory protein [Burkholderiaceae bacterium]